MYMDIDATLILAKTYLKGLFLIIALLNLILIFSPNLFTSMAIMLQKKRGYHKMMFPFLERERMGFNNFLFHNRKIVGTLGVFASLFSFYLLR